LRLGILAAAVPPLLFVILAGFGGCDPYGISVSGKVTADGIPLARGSIRFVTESQDQPSAEVGSIVDGEYAISASERLVPGKYIVQILGIGQDLTSLMPTPDGVVPRGSPGWIPAQYNSTSVIRVEIPRRGPHRFDFDLKL
jgi:hypothetical protein